MADDRTPPAPTFEVGAQYIRIDHGWKREMPDGTYYYMPIRLTPKMTRD